jgi:hypothetical protein
MYKDSEKQEIGWVSLSVNFDNSDTKFKQSNCLPFLKYPLSKDCDYPGSSQKC